MRRSFSRAATRSWSCRVRPASHAAGSSSTPISIRSSLSIYAVPELLGGDNSQLPTSNSQTVQSETHGKLGNLELGIGSWTLGVDTHHSTEDTSTAASFSGLSPTHAFAIPIASCRT